MVGGAFAAGLALPGGASAQMYKAYDNGVLAYSTSDQIAHTIFLDGTNDAVVSTFDNPLGVPGTVGGWSVDGNRLLVLDKPSGSVSNLRDVNPWTKTQVKRVDEAFPIFGPSMSPDGTSYAYGSAGGVRVSDGTSSTEIWPVDDGSDGTAWSNEDHLLVGLNGPNGIYRFNAYGDGSSAGDNWVVSDDPIFPIAPSISRDGKRVAYTAFGVGETGPTNDVFWVNADGSENPVRLEAATTNGSIESYAAIAPDGSKVAFVSNRRGNGEWAIYTIDLPTTANPNPNQTPKLVPNTVTTKGYNSLSWQPAQVPYLAEGSITTSPAIGNTIKQDMAFDMPTAPVITEWQWQRCTGVLGTPNNYSGGICTDMPGETGEGYKLLPGDVGAQFRVVRTVTNGAGTDVQASEITEPGYVPDSTPPGVPTIGTKPTSPSNATAPTFTWTGAEGGGTYRCSVDNAAFTACSSGGTFPVTGDGPHTFRVKQVDDSDNAGDPAEHTWTLDTGAPSTPNVTSKPPAVTNATSATFAFTGDEVDGSFECRVGSDAAAWVACTSPADLTGLTEGSKRFSIRQLDKAGNASDAEIVTWTVDRTGPSAPTITTKPGASSKATAPTFAWTGAEGGGTYECSIDNGAFTTCSSGGTFPVTGETSHGFRVRQVDAAGNAGTPAEHTWTLDTTKPVAPSITTKPGTRSKDTAPSFGWTPAEGGGTFQCSIDNGAFTTCTTGGTFPVTGEGPHTFRVKQLDAAGNDGDVAEHTWTLDTTAPGTPNVTAKPDAITKSKAATIAFTGAEAGGTFECRIGKDGWEACTSPVTLTELDEGDVSYSIRQVDAAGNLGDAALVEWTVDATAPVKPVLTTDLGLVKTREVQVQFTGEGDGTFECQLDSGAWKACTSPHTLKDYVSGDHTFRVREIDAAGNVGAIETDDFSADVDGPAKPTFTKTPDKFVTTKKVVFEFTGADPNGTGFECELEEHPGWEPCVSGMDVDDLPEATYTLAVRQIGQNGFAGESAKFTWTYDKTAPAKPVVLKAPVAETTSTSIPDFTVAGEQDAARECSLDDHTWTDCANVMGKTDLELGPHELAIRLKDKAGNVSDFVLLTWTVVAPKPDPKPETPVTPSTPVVPTPAVETPAKAVTPEAPKVTTTPKAETTTVAKPKLAAIIGGTNAGNGNGSGTDSAATITVKNDGVGVGCSITGTVLTSCTVDLYAAAPATGATARAAAAKQVLVGTGTYRKAEGSKKLEVDVTLNATGRALMRKSPNGLKVSVKITGTPVKGEKLEATGIATLVRQRLSARVGGFAVNSAKLTPAAKRHLVKLAKQVRGTAVAIRVVGHTDASSDDAGYLKGLGKRRAQTVAAFLRTHGVKAKATLVSQGARAPRATNATKAGRALNRRVELRIDR